VLLRAATLTDGRVCDVRTGDGRVLDVRPSGPDVPAGDESLDLSGWLLLPAPAEPHAHLDKALSADLVGGPPGDLPAAVAAWSAYSTGLEHDEVLTRARRATRELIAHGVTAVRSHANVTTGPDPLVAVRALAALRAELRDSLDLQVVVLSRPDTPDGTLRAALAAGADLLGGGPHLASEPLAEQDRLVRLAAACGVGLDLHTDEQLEPGARTLDALAAAVAGTTLAGRVTASHCVSLGMRTGADLEAVVRAVRDAGIGVVTLPLTNLFLQGRHSATSPPRGLTALRPLLAAGVPLAAGGDNVRDPFNPVGRSDPLEVASLLVTAGHLNVDEAYAAVSSTARQVMGLPVAGPEPGCVADLLAVRAVSLGDAVARAPEDRIVIRHGRIVAASTVRRWTALR
jgi:cytosine deaminase